MIAISWTVSTLDSAYSSRQENWFSDRDVSNKEAYDCGRVYSLSLKPERTHLKRRKKNPQNLSEIKCHDTADPQILEYTSVPTFQQLAKLTIKKSSVCYFCFQEGNDKV